MYECDWVVAEAWRKETQLRPPPSLLRRQDVLRTSLLRWEEHCTECAGPTCFETCLLYDPRADGGCRRFAYGIYPNPQFQGLFEFGADPYSFSLWAASKEWFIH